MAELVTELLEKLAMRHHVSLRDALELADRQVDKVRIRCTHTEGKQEDGPPPLRAPDPHVWSVVPTQVILAMNLVHVLPTTHTVMHACMSDPRRGSSLAKGPSDEAVQ